MPSRFLAQQESLASSPATGAEVHLANARIAAYRARRGEEDKAKATIASMRTLPREMLGAPLLSLINIAEGLIHFKAGDARGGIEKWLRARAIALSCGHAEGTCVSSAWLAFAAYQAENIDAMAEHSRVALAHCASDYPQAISRLCLTIGLSLHYCGNYAKARKNYMRCHRAATLCGDEVELSALMYDTAAMFVHDKRCAEFVDREHKARSSEISTRLDSVTSYEDLVGVRSLPSLSPILLAQESVLEQRWADAIELIDKNLARSEADGFARLVPGLLADRALCLAMLGQRSAVGADIESSLLALTSADMHRDDLALLYSRLSQVHELCGDSEKSAELAIRAAAAWKEVNAFKKRMILAAVDLDDRLGGELERSK